jgi:hypothetical protein
VQSGIYNEHAENKAIWKEEIRIDGAEVGILFLRVASI